MQFLIREVRVRRDGSPEYTDRELAGSTLSFGSGANQDIQLEGVGIGAAHGTIRVSGKRATLRCRGGNRVVVADQRVARTPFGPGTEVIAGSHRLIAIAAPAGFDFALEVHYGAGLKAEDFEKTFPTRLEQTWLRRRPLAWVSVIAVLLAFLAVPLWLAQQRNAGKLPPSHLVRLLPSDRLWSTGALIPAHQQAIGDNCGACHKKLFQPVRDESCAACHGSVHEHVAAERLKLTQLKQTPPSCESCHREHEVPASAIIVRDNALCVACHGKAETQFGALEIKSVVAFDSVNHPQFKLHLLKEVADDPLAGTADAPWRYSVPVNREGAKENSHLTFSHKQHLDASRVSSRKHEGGMACADCHVLNADGLRFRAITMRDACVSCHELTFDPSEPTRQLPHGKPREVVATIEEFYARRYLEPNAVPTSTFVRRLTPGEADKVDETRCTESAAVCAPRVATRVIEAQFHERGCKSCHDVTDNHATDIAERFSVRAVKLGNEFYPHANFKHSSHLIQNDLTGDAACNSCHAAQKSADSSDVLIPGIDNCVTCHSDAAGDTRAQTVRDTAGATAPLRRAIVPLGCIGCHRYHPDTRKTTETSPQIASR